MALSSLPSELLVSIFQQLSSPQDLYSAIRATSRFYSVFAEYRSSILSAILLRAIPPQVEADLLLAYHAQQIWDFALEEREDDCNMLSQDGGQEKLEALRQRSMDILELAKAGKGEQLCVVRVDGESLPKLWRFYWKFQDLILLCIAEALSNLEKVSSASDETPEKLPLSSGEQIRFQRAFYRWEVYTCLFQYLQVAHEDEASASVTDPAPEYATMFQPWEVEEIFCVGRFYYNLLEEISERVDEDFVTIVKAKHAVFSPTELDMLESEDWDLDDLLEFHCLWWFDDGFRGYGQEEVFNWVVSRGMLAVWKLKHAPFRTVRRMIVGSYFGGQNQIDIMERVEDDEFESDDDDTPQDCSFGWQWAAAGMERMYPVAHVNSELRNQGYVFWDQARLEKVKQFQSPRGRVRPHESLESPTRETLPSIETRLEDLTLHSRVIGDICEEILYVEKEGVKVPGGYSALIDWRNCGRTAHRTDIEREIEEF